MSNMSECKTYMWASLGGAGIFIIFGVVAYFTYTWMVHEWSDRLDLMMGTNKNTEETVGTDNNTT